MSFKIKCGCLFAISLFTVVNATDTKTAKGGDLGEVLVNISKVNGLIQELIQNYKELKKMTNSDLESDYGEKQTSFQEEDRNRENRNRAVKKVKKASTTKNKGLATAMFISDGETGLEIENDEGKRFKDKKPRKKKNKQRNKLKTTDNEFYDDTANAKSKTHPDYPSITTEVNFADYSNSSVFKVDRTAAPIEALRDLMVSFVDDVITPRFKPALYPATMPKYELTTTTMYPKVVGNIFDIRPSTPSKKHLEPRLDYDSPWPGIRKRLSHRKSRKKPEIIYLRSGKKSKRESKQKRTTEKEKTRDSKSAWEGEKEFKMEKEINSLRHAYGDACLMLVARKCKMACKSVYRESCHGEKLCSKALKATFKKHAIQGCNKEFGHNASMSFRAAKTALQEGKNKKDGFVDMTRDGYLAMACLPGEGSKSLSGDKAKHKRKKNKPDRRHKKIIAVAKSKEIDKPDTLLILRDRYERACSRESAQKCVRACKSAVTAAIAKEPGKSRKKTFMIKKCKKHCSKAYNVEGYSSSSSDDSTESESGSDENEE